MTVRVHMMYNVGPAALAHLSAELAPEIDLTVGSELPEPADHEILVAGRPERKQITASPALDRLVIPWAGLPEETRALMRDFPIIAVHNLHHNAMPTAEMAVSLMLAAAKSIVPADRALRRGDWSARYRDGLTVLTERKTALILGYGSVGQHAARLLEGLGMEVMAIRRHASQDGPDQVYPAEALPSLLPRADVLIICLPLTEETEGLIGEEELASLPPRAVLVNVARGTIVDEGALYRALHDGDLHAAGLDVWYNYPESEAERMHTPPSAYPFHELDNVVMSPHRAGAGGVEEVERRRMEHLARLLNKAARGGDVPNRVDLEAGY